VRLPDELGHAPVQGFSEVRHVAAPDRLRGARNLESLAGENLLQPVQRQIIGELARHDISQQPRPRQSPLDRRVGPCRQRDLGRFSYHFAVCAGILLAHVLDALEAPGHVLDLPTLLRADLLALDSAARAGALCGAQLVDLRGDRQVLEVRQVASSPAPLHPPQLRGRFVRRGRVIRRDRFLCQFLAEGEERLPKLLAGFQLVGTRPVVPLPVAFQLQLQTQVFEIECVGTLGLLRREGGFGLGQGLVLGGTPLGAIPLGPCRSQQFF